MASRHNIALFLALSLLANAFCLPSNATYRKRRNLSDNKINTSNDNTTKKSKDSSSDDSLAITSEEDTDDDDDFKPQPSGGGSNIFSLLNIANALLPSLSGSSNVKKNNEFVKKVIQDVITQYQARKIQKRQDVDDNVIDIDYATELKPPFFQRQESEENDDNDSEASESNSEDSEEDNGGEESIEQASSENGSSKSKQDSASNASNGNGESAASDDDNDSDYDEPEGDGQGGGILGLLAGLSGDGESDLGSLLAAVGGIIASLSGDGVDINAIISTGLGLLVGLLSDEGSNPGEIIASYLLTSLDTITGGGAQNNGAFFGKFLSTLLKGTSAAQKGVSSDPGESPFITLKMNIFRAILQFGSSMLGLASSGTSTSSTPAT